MASENHWRTAPAGYTIRWEGEGVDADLYMADEPSGLAEIGSSYAGSVERRNPASVLISNPATAVHLAAHLLLWAHEADPDCPALRRLLDDIAARLRR